jgi:hypothetical protein
MRQKNYADLLSDLDSYVRLDRDSPAGLRAKEMREEVAQELVKQGQAAPTKSKPQ